MKLSLLPNSRRWLVWATVAAVLPLVWLGCATAPDDDTAPPKPQETAEPEPGENDGPEAVPEKLQQRLINLQEAIQREPENPELYFEAGNVLFDMEQYSNAVLAYREAIDRNPEFGDAYTNLGLALRRIGRFAEAIAAYEQALEHQPEDLVTLRNLKVAAEYSNDPERMLFAARRLAQLQPDNPDAQAEYAALLLENERYEEAQAIYERLINREEAVAIDFYNLGLIHYRQERWKQAAETWENALERDPEDRPTYQALSLLYWQREEFEKARDVVKRGKKSGIAFDPGFLDALRNKSTGQRGEASR